MPTEISSRIDQFEPIRDTSPPLLQLNSFDRPDLAHGFSHRHGGISSGAFDSLNISFGVGDDEAAVRENRSRLKQILGFTTMISARQVHGNKILVLNHEPESDLEADGYDGLVTDRQVGLMIQQADCQAVIFHDPVRQVIGAAHAGWRGSVAGIIGATVQAMTDSFATNPADLHAAISPSLGPCCAEFINYRQELPGWMHHFQVRPNYFDFWAISRRQLQAAGLLPAKINTAGICTSCSSDHFSYRRSKVTGRCATLIGLVGR